MPSAFFENREFNRLLFSTQKAVTAQIMKNGDPKIVIPVTVLNLSEGGLGLAVAKHTTHAVSENEELELVMVEGEMDLSFLIGTRLKVCWLLQNPALNHVCFGCQFINPSFSTTEMIHKIVSDRVG